MVTVALELDAPIKILIVESIEDGANRPLAIFGPGDIALPGIMLGLALRFDLYLFYLKKQKGKERQIDLKPVSETLAVRRQPFLTKMVLIRRSTSTLLEVGENHFGWAARNTSRSKGRAFPRSIFVRF